jgi:protein-tyrosine phosphatase family protein
MDASEPSPAPPQTPRARRFSRRTLLRLAGAGAIAGVSIEAARVFAGSNEHTVIPGRVYRSAQLSREKLERTIADKKIRTVINLRGCCPAMAWYQADAGATHATGISQEDITLSAKRYPHPGEIGRLIEVFDRTDYPVLLHCAAGADRTGLASAIAVLLLTDPGLAAARRQLWPRYGHFAVGRMTRLDEFLDYYERELEASGDAHTPERFRRWFAQSYCPGPFRAELTLLGATPLIAAANRGFTATVRAINRSVEPWTFATGGSGGIQLRFTVYTRAGAQVHRGHAGLFARTVHPGETIDLVAGFPPLKAGIYMLHADLLDAQPIDLLDTDFAQYGSEPLIVDLRVK